MAELFLDAAFDWTFQERIQPHTPTGHAQRTADVLSWSLDFKQLLWKIQAIDIRIENLLNWRGEQSQNMWKVKLALSEPGTQQLTQEQVYDPQIEAAKIRAMTECLNWMDDKSESTKVKKFLPWFISVSFPLIFAHSRDIQWALNYGDQYVRKWVDEYKEIWELSKIQLNLRKNIHAIDESIISDVIERMKLFLKYNWVLSPEQSSQLLPEVGSEFLRSVFQAINNLCLKVRW